MGKKERVAKNELQRLENIKKNMQQNGAADKKKLKEELTKDIDLAKVSTASLGKFQANLQKESTNKLHKISRMQHLQRRTKVEKLRTKDSVKVLRHTRTNRNKRKKRLGKSD